MCMLYAYLFAFPLLGGWFKGIDDNIGRGGQNVRDCFILPLQDHEVGCLDLLRGPLNQSTACFRHDSACLSVWQGRCLWSGRGGCMERMCHVKGLMNGWIVMVVMIMTMTIRPSDRSSTLCVFFFVSISLFLPPPFSHVDAGIIYGLSSTSALCACACVGFAVHSCHVSHLFLHLSLIVSTTHTILYFVP